MSSAIVSIRRKYDQARIEVSERHRNIERIEQDKKRVEDSRIQIERQVEAMKQDYEGLLVAEREGLEMNEQGDYRQSVRLHMKDSLRHDILNTKKRCFDENIRLIRTKTFLKELTQRSTNKQHHKSKCKLVLNSLQQTVQTRGVARTTHLLEVEGMLRKKLDNCELKNGREQFLEESMEKALTDRLPEENFFGGKFKC